MLMTARPLLLQNGIKTNCYEHGYCEIKVVQWLEGFSNVVHGQLDVAVAKAISIREALS
ncbi:hypothetical protein Scep_008622 [Stephania cephalantha]|uniref:Uncharacterized protein n=1 Tax=Stephania cephalantha TaxID=152367 RepID=A0AAP0KER9_9MAGN